MAQLAIADIATDNLELASNLELELTDVRNNNAREDEARSKSFRDKVIWELLAMACLWVGDENFGPAGKKDCTMHYWDTHERNLGI